MSEAFPRQRMDLDLRGSEESKLGASKHAYINLSLSVLDGRWNVISCFKFIRP